MSWHRAVATALVLAALSALAASPARAQEAPPDSSTSTSTTSTTAAPVTPSTLPGAPTLPIDPNAPTTTTVPPPEEDPAANADSPPETVPDVDITVPPRPPAAAYGDQPPFSSAPGRVVRVSSRTARAHAAETQAALDAAQQRVDLLALRRTQLEDEIDRLAGEEQDAIEALEQAQVDFRNRAADAYIRGNITGGQVLVMSDSGAQFAQRQELLEVVIENDERSVREYRAARAAVDDEQQAAADELARVSLELRAAEEALVAAFLEHDLASRELAVFLNGGTLVIHGFAFPVSPVSAVNYSDSFGAPRMPGTIYEHWHEGTDILAPMGTPLVACERGVVLSVGRGGVLGGNSVWLRGESGTAYYYAHLSTFEDGIQPGLVVDAGTIVGYVGDTGNARGGPPHLHFEVHPGGGPAINPYPILKASEDQPQPDPIPIEG
jgi:murein DD-endopeptidase MepM/ murein hydrolase activator NlpD